MSDSLARRSEALVEHTRNLIDALELKRSDAEIDRLIERQREVFSDFSRRCEPSIPLDASSRANVDAALNLEKKLVTLVERKRDDLIAQGRVLAGRMTHARAFQSSPPEPPRFVTRRV